MVADDPGEGVPSLGSSLHKSVDIMREQRSDKEIEKILVRAVRLGGDGARCDGSVILVPQGELGGAEAIRLGRRIDEYLAGGDRWVIVDFQHVTGLSGSGIGILLRCAAVARAADGELCLVRLGREVTSALSLIGGGRCFRVAPDPETAIREFTEQNRA